LLLFLLLFILQLQHLPLPLPPHFLRCHARMSLSGIRPFTDSRLQPSGMTTIISITPPSPAHCVRRPLPSRRERGIKNGLSQTPSLPSPASGRGKEKGGLSHYEGRGEKKAPSLDHPVPAFASPVFATLRRGSLW
jgi:hypothetical protein